jgi:hypothetical protein
MCPCPAQHNNTKEAVVGIQQGPIAGPGLHKQDVAVRVHALHSITLQKEHCWQTAAADLTLMKHDVAVCACPAKSTVGASQHCAGIAYYQRPAQHIATQQGARWLSGANASLTNRMLLYVSMPCTHTLEHVVVAECVTNALDTSSANRMLLYVSMPCTAYSNTKELLANSKRNCWSRLTQTGCCCMCPCPAQTHTLVQGC